MFIAVCLTDQKGGIREVGKFLYLGWTNKYEWDYGFYFHKRNPRINEKNFFLSTDKQSNASNVKIINLSKLFFLIYTII